MKTRHAIPEDAPDKSANFNHYAEIFKVFKKGSTIFKPVSVILATLGLMLSLSLIQFENGKPQLTFGWFSFLPAGLIFYFVWVLFSMNEKAVSTLVRYIFLGTAKIDNRARNQKKWFNLSDIIFHVLIILPLVIALTLGFISINHNAGESIGLALRQTKDDKKDNQAVLTQDSAYLAKKDTIESKYIALFNKRSETINSQIKSEKDNLKLISRNEKEQRLEQQKAISNLEAKKVELQESLDSIKAIELVELALLYKGSTGELKASMQDIKAQFLQNIQKAISLITKFLGFDVIFVVVCAIGLEIIHQKNGIQPVFGVEHGDFDESSIKEILLKYPRILKVRLLNWARRRYVPAQDAPTEENVFFNRGHFRRQTTQQRTRTGNRTRANMVFQNP